MFKASLVHDQEQEMQFKKEQFLQERLTPDCRQATNWLQDIKRRFLVENRLMRLLIPAQATEDPMDAEFELFVPDDRLALLIQDGVPLRLYQPGRYRCQRFKAKVEVRLLPLDSLRDKAPMDFWNQDSAERLRLVERMPYERSHLYVDGVLVSMVKPAQSATGTSGKPNALPAPRLLVAAHPNVVMALRTDEGDDYIQDFSFI